MWTNTRSGSNCYYQSQHYNRPRASPDSDEDNNCTRLVDVTHTHTHTHTHVHTVTHTHTYCIFSYTANTGVANLRATGPSATMLDITWAAPTTPHGFVNRYTITVVNMDAKTGTADATTPVPKDTRSITVPGFTTSFCKYNVY